MSEYLIGVSAYYHDSSACLFKDNKLLFACEEEKFTGIKHDNSFPINTINYIFDKYHLSKKDIECVCYYEHPKMRLKRKKSYLISLLNMIRVHYNLKKISKNIHYTPHHISHMTYSYLSSNFNDSLIVSVDGVGEISTVSIGKGENGKVTQLKTIEYPKSFGLFYSAMTAFLGFKPNEGEYKVMGLASYGDPSLYRTKIKELFYYLDGDLFVNMKYFIWNKSNTLMFNEKLEDFLCLSCRLPDDKIEKYHKDLAASIQEAYEMSFFELLKDSKKIYYSENLCLGGGCAYNGAANGKIVENKKLFKKLWIPPAPSDAGSAIGTCLDYLSKKYKIRIKTNPFLGPSYSDEEIVKILDSRNDITYIKYSNKDLLKNVAIHLNDGLVIGWFRGRIEFGARALGNRSILANPTLPYMKDKINAVIKKREGFRPFAPMVCFDKQFNYFNSKQFIPYMNQVVKVNEQYLDKLLAVTHIDGTARIQSVIPYNQIYDLLIEYEKISGYPILLNTSFNIKDKTMVLTPLDAIETFINTEMDLLVIEKYLIMKK